MIEDKKCCSDSELFKQRVDQFVKDLDFSTHAARLFKSYCLNETGEKGLFQKAFYHILYKNTGYNTVNTKLVLGFGPNIVINDFLNENDWENVYLTERICRQLEQVVINPKLVMHKLVEGSYYRLVLPVRMLDAISDFCQRMIETLVFVNGVAYPQFILAEMFAKYDELYLDGAKITLQKNRGTDQLRVQYEDKSIDYIKVSYDFYQFVSYLREFRYK